jgi:hypothetical protein
MNLDEPSLTTSVSVTGSWEVFSVREDELTAFPFA